MNIIHVIDSGGVYGAERVLLSLSSECLKLGHRCVIATIVSPADDGNPLADEARLLGIEVVEFVMDDGMRMKAFRQVCEYASKNAMDVFHTHGYRANILSAVSRHSGGYCTVTTLHGWTGVRLMSRLWLYESAEKLLLGRFDLVVAVSPSLYQSRAVRHVARNRLLIANGIDETVDGGFGNGTIDGFIDGRRAVAAAGRLSYEKGFDRLVSAFAKVIAQEPDLRLVVFGEGEARADLQEQIDRLHLQDYVLLPGFTDRIRDHLPKFEIFVLPSRTEGLPIVVLEAMFSGIPVLATDVGSVAWLLDNSAGVIVRNQDSPNELAAEMGRLLQNKELMRAMGAAGASRVSGRFTAHAMAKQYLRAYSQLVTGTG